MKNIHVHLIIKVGFQKRTIVEMYFFVNQFMFFRGSIHTKKSKSGLNSKGKRHTSTQNIENKL